MTAGQRQERPRGEEPWVPERLAGEAGNCQRAGHVDCSASPRMQGRTGSAWAGGDGARATVVCGSVREGTGHRQLTRLGTLVSPAPPRHTCVSARADPMPSRFGRAARARLGGDLSGRRITRREGATTVNGRTGDCDILAGFSPTVFLQQPAEISTSETVLSAVASRWASLLSLLGVPCRCAQRREPDDKSELV